MHISLRVFFIFFTLNFNVFACPPPVISDNLIIAIEKIFSTSGVWHDFNPQKLKLAFDFGDNNKILLFNFTDAELMPVSSYISSCGRNNKWKILEINAIPAITNGVYVPLMPNINGSILEKLAGRIEAPILLINSNAKIGDFVLETEDIARIAVHEMFHFAHQFSKKFTVGNSYERTFLDSCVKNQHWIIQVKKEFASWQRILRNWSKISNSKLKNEILAILRHRQQSNQSKVRYCWDATAFWERLEGTAFYVEIQSAHIAGLVSKIQIRKELSKYFYFNSQSVCTGCPNSGNGSIDQGFFYGTGALITLALERLTRSTLFQKDIEKGMTPAELFLSKFDKISRLMKKSICFVKSLKSHFNAPLKVRLRSI